MLCKSLISESHWGRVPIVSMWLFTLNAVPTFITIAGNDAPSSPLVVQSRVSASPDGGPERVRHPVGRTRHRRHHAPSAGDDLALDRRAPGLPQRVSRVRDTWTRREAVRLVWHWAVAVDAARRHRWDEPGEPAGVRELRR